MKTMTTAAPARRRVWARVLLAALLALSLGGCFHTDAGEASPGTEREGGGDGGY